MKFRQNLDRIQTDFRQNLDRIQTDFRQIIDKIQIEFRHNLDKIQTLEVLRRNLEEIQRIIQTEFRQNLDVFRQNLDRIQIKFRCIYIKFRQNLIRIWDPHPAAEDLSPCHPAPCEQERQPQQRYHWDPPVRTEKTFQKVHLQGNKRKCNSA